MPKIVKRKRSSDTKVTEIKVLLRENNIVDRIFTLEYPDVSALCDEFDVITAVFAKNKVTKEKQGYKLMDGNTVKTVTIVQSHTAIDFQFYEINVQSPETCTLRKSNRLQTREQFSDVTLRVDDRDINAHKLILANASPVFKAMMLTESPSNKVKINDISYDTACDMLNFIYTGKIPDDHAKHPFLKYSNLLKAADKYCIAGLKTKCEKEISQILSNHNVINYLNLANLHNALQLQQLAIDFIVDNADEVINLPSYKNYVQGRPEILTKIIQGLVAKQKSAK